MNNLQKKYITILIIFLLALASSLILTFAPVEKICSPNENLQATCVTIQESTYEKTFGIENNILGIAAFSLISLLIILHLYSPRKETKKLILAGTILGSAIALYLIYLQFFVIHAICKYCMVADGGTILALILMIFWKEK